VSANTDLVTRTAALPVAARNASTDALTRKPSPPEIDQRTEHPTHVKNDLAAEEPTTGMESTTDHRECSRTG